MRTADLIEADTAVTILNPDHVVATLTDEVDFEAALKVAKSRGYQPASDQYADREEEIVGEIRDEVEPHEDDIVKESENSFLVAGHAEVSHLADLFDAAVEGRDYNTVSGLIISKLGRVPPVGERVEKGGLNFEVLESNTRTVLRVRVVRPGSSLKPSPDSHVP